MQNGWLKIVENKKYKGFSVEKAFAKKLFIPIKRLSQILMYPNKYKKFYNI
jgi:predicted RNA-binding protein (virulence factor B family)